MVGFPATFFLSVVQNIQADSGVHPVPCGIGALVFPPGVKQLGREAVTHFSQVPRLRMSVPYHMVGHPRCVFINYIALINCRTI